MNKLAVITVNYNNYKITENFLSYFNQKDNNYKIFISDLSDYKQKITNNSCRIIFGENKGYAHGVNLGLKQAIKEGFSFFAIINNDTRVSENFVENTLESLKNNPKSIIGGKIYYEREYEYHKNKYKPNDLGKILWYAGGLVDWKNVLTNHRGVDEIDQGKYDDLEKTDFVTGCLMCFSKSVINKIGFWDEKYFLYYEDTDYCERAKRKGINLYYDPSIVIWHKNAQSTGGSGSKLHQKYQEKNRLIFGLKYAPLKTKAHLLMNYFLK